MSGDTTTQSEIATGNTYLNGQTAPGANYIKLPTNADGSRGAVDSFINVQTFSPAAWGNTYQGLVNFLQPGDILYIDGSARREGHARDHLARPVRRGFQWRIPTSHHRLDGDHAAAR